jgi:hypothetical protein
VGGDVLIDSETFLVTDFMNFKIKPAQSFRCAHMDRVSVHVFIGVSNRTCMNIYVKKKETANRSNFALQKIVKAIAAWHSQPSQQKFQHGIKNFNN